VVVESDGKCGAGAGADGTDVGERKGAGAGAGAADGGPGGVYVGPNVLVDEAVVMSGEIEEAGLGGRPDFGGQLSGLVVKVNVVVKVCVAVACGAVTIRVRVAVGVTVSVVVTARLGGEKRGEEPGPSVWVPEVMLTEEIAVAVLVTVSVTSTVFVKVENQVLVVTVTVGCTLKEQYFTFAANRFYKSRQFSTSRLLVLGPGSRS
jgi:hypothetical protein